MGLCVTVWDFGGVGGCVGCRGCMGLYGTVWGHRGLHGVVRAVGRCMAPYGVEEVVLGRMCLCGL